MQGSYRAHFKLLYCCWAWLMPFGWIFWSWSHKVKKIIIWFNFWRKSWYFWHMTCFNWSIDSYWNLERSLYKLSLLHPFHALVFLTSGIFSLVSLLPVSSLTNTLCAHVSLVCLPFSTNPFSSLKVSLVNSGAPRHCKLNLLSWSRRKKK